MSSPVHQSTGGHHHEHPARPLWDQPEESCGDFITKLPRGKSAWMAVGKAAYAWQSTLSPQIRRLLEAEDAFYGAGVSMFIYMVGRDKSTSSPRIIFCSSDVGARKAVRKAVQTSGILKNYPAIGLGDSSSPLARGDSGLLRHPPDWPTRPGPQNHRMNRRIDVGASKEPSNKAQPAIYGSETVLGAGATGDWQTARHETLGTLRRRFETMSIASGCPSSLSLDDSTFSNLRGSLSSNRLSDWTPRTSVHDTLVLEQAQSDAPTEKDIDSNTPDTPNSADSADSEDDRESCSESDGMEDSNPDSLHPAIARELDQIVSKLLGAYDSSRQQTGTTASQAAGNAEDTSASNPGGSSQDNRGIENGASQVALGKRPLAEDDRDGALITDSKRTKTAHQRGRVFACPYWKKDPLAYSRCFKLELKEVKRVKQHLYRSHTKAIRCPRCQQVFPDRTSCDSHLASVDCPRQSLRVIDEGINEDQVTKLGRNGPKLDQVQRWYAVWRIVFPSVTEPASPYIDGDLSEVVSEFREFYQRRGITIVLDHMRTSPDWSPSDEERFRQGFWRNIWDEALEGILRRWLAERAGVSGSQASVSTAIDTTGEDPSTDVALDSSPSPGDGGAAIGSALDGAGFHSMGNFTTPSASQTMARFDGANDGLLEDWEVFWTNDSFNSQH
ncbi:hypothetical protein MMYC01_210690 [Madurella mycetomatis]|uniref:C2H2-type domain-containing protein n=1 Tax=Madurella mycetomatis TaxID=100816 RepID=A0A175VMP5_9PEZI|nr:hypothetical protein MMYC01_210690 [Madurella mycetomatis]